MMKDTLRFLSLSEIINRYNIFHWFQNEKVTPWIISTVTAVAGTTINIYSIFSYLILFMIVILSIILLILLFCEIFRQNNNKNYQQLSKIDY